jgi:hypothetical protein
LDVVLPERNLRDLHDNKLHLQHNLEDDWIVEREGIRRVAAWLGSLWAATFNLLVLPTTVMKNIMGFHKEQAVKALPIKATDGQEFGAISSLVQSLKGETIESKLDATRRPSSGETYKASDSPYHSVNHQLYEALKTLTQQQEAAAHQLAAVHRHYDGLRAQYETKQPSAPDA